MEKLDLKIYLVKYRNNIMRDSIVMAKDLNEARKAAIALYRKNSMMFISNLEVIDSITLAEDQSVYYSNNTTPVSEFTIEKTNL